MQPATTLIERINSDRITLDTAGCPIIHEGAIILLGMVDREGAGSN